MNNLKLKLSMLLCLLAVGLGSATAQSVKFKHNEYRAYSQSSLATPKTISFNELKSSVTSWSVQYWDRTLNTSSQDLISDASSLRSKVGLSFNWFTLQYQTPSYTKTTYKVTYTVSIPSSNKKSRASYFDFGDSDTKWKARNQTPTGNTTLALYNATSLASGEKYFVDRSNFSGGSNEISVSIDNSTGNSDKTTNRYGGFSFCHESSYNGNSAALKMNCSTQSTYYKIVTFNANGGTGSMSQQAIGGSGSLSTNTFTREGYSFVGWNTKDDGTGDSYTQNQSISVTSTTKGPVILYAQWKALEIKAKFDYTYRTSDVGNYQEVYVHMGEGHDADAFTSKVRANFRDASGAAFKSVVLTAPEATNGAETPTADASTHKTAEITLKLASSGDDVLEGSDCKVNLGDKLSDFHSVDFEVLMQDESAVAPHWAVRMQNAASYVFKYEGHESTNMFDLKWRVNLKNLSMYPSDIFVKPMRKQVGSDLAEIPAMSGSDGEECELAGYFDAQGNDVTIEDYNAKNAEEKVEFNKTGGAYYTGEYRVLRKDASGYQLSYALGLTGFILNGDYYYLAATEGDVPNDMKSASIAAPTEQEATIKYDRSDIEIPVLILSPGVDNSTLDVDKQATVHGKTDFMLYVDNDEHEVEGQRTVNLEQFLAVRPNYTFLGWKDAYDGTSYEANGTYTFDMGNKATTTLVAQWERTTAPQIELNELNEAEGKFVYTVNVADDLNDLQNVNYIYAAGEEAPNKDDSGWLELSLTDGVGTIELPTLNDNSGKNLWVMASNESKTTFANLGEIRSIFKVTANPNPDSMTAIETPINDEQNPTITTYYYDHYSTFYYSGRTFKSYEASAYTATINGSKLELNKVEASEDGAVVIPQGTAVILRKEQAEVNDNLIELEECATSNASSLGNSLKGLDEADSDETYRNYYIFSYAQYGLGFYLNSSDTLAAHKAYIPQQEGGVRAFTLNFGEGDPIVEAIREIEATGKTSVIIDLSGRKVMDGGKHGGIYMKGGSKLLK